VTPQPGQKTSCGKGVEQRVGKAKTANFAQNRRKTAGKYRFPAVEKCRFRQEKRCQPRFALIMRENY
jgi:hypothetical protein